jgi:hypothetical protein
MRRMDWLAVIMLMAALGSGCAGFQVGTPSKWSTWDHSNAKQDDKSIMLKKVLNF